MIRWRLTAYFVLAVTVVLGGFSVVVFESTRAGVLAEIQREARSRAALVAASVRVDPDGTVHAPSLRGLADTDYVQVYDTRGQTLAKSANLRRRDLPFRPARFDGRRVEEVRVDQVPMYLSGHPVRYAGQIRAYVVAGRSPGPLYQVLHRLREVLLPGTVVALGLAGLVMWLVVGRTVNPLARLANAAEQIRVRGDHTGRVGPVDRRDEIGRLAATIDGMLAALEDSHSQVAAAHTAQRRFLTHVSHELRAPLTIVLSSLELLQRFAPGDPGFRDQVLADIRAEVQRMARMVTRLLIVARSADSASLAHRPVLLGDLLQDICRHWSRQAPDRRLEFGGIGELDDVVVDGDEDHLRQLFVVLLENAINFTSGAGRVAVSGTTRDGEVRVVVSDDGIGIPAEDLPHVFDRFYRGHNGAARKGTGLGLAIAQHVAEQHGGGITAASTPGSGSRFTVTLPLYTSKQAPR